MAADGVSRRKFLTFGMVSALTLDFTSQRQSDDSLKIKFTWRYPQPMTYDEAARIEAEVVDVPRLTKMNEEFIAKGELKSFSCNVHPDRVCYEYTFASVSSYLKWEYALRSNKIIDYAKAEGLYKIDNSFWNKMGQIPG